MGAGFARKRSERAYASIPWFTSRYIQRISKSREFSPSFIHFLSLFGMNGLNSGYSEFLSPSRRRDRVAIVTSYGNHLGDSRYFLLCREYRLVAFPLSAADVIRAERAGIGYTHPSLLSGAERIVVHDAWNFARSIDAACEEFKKQYTREALL